MRIRNLSLFHFFFNFQITRSSLNVHCSENMETHLSLVTLEVRAMKEENKRQVSRLQEELEETKQTVNDLRSELEDYQQTNEIEQRFGKEFDALMSEMNATLESVENERATTTESIQNRVKSFDEKFDLLEDRLDNFNAEMERFVAKSVEKFSGKIQSFKRRDIEGMLAECVRYSMGREFDGRLTLEMREKFKLGNRIEESQVLMEKVCLVVALIQGLSEKFTFAQRFHGLMRNMNPNVKTRYGNNKFVLKLEMLEYFKDEWTIIILKKQNISFYDISSMSAMRFNDLLVNQTMKTIALFLDEEMFVRDVPSLSVCSPRGKYKLRLPTQPKDDFKFRINFTTLVASNYLTDGYVLLHATEVPKLSIDPSFFQRSSTFSN